MITGLLSVYYLLTLLFKLKKLRLLGATKRLCGFLVFALITGFLSIITIGTQGYRALTKEEPVAVVKVSSYEPQNFQARLIFADGEQQVFSIQGDELFIDAYILKWQSWANFLGLHTAYRLERIGGRYKDINQEKSQPKSVHAIAKKSGEGIAYWREKYQHLSFLLDVQHGSASFVEANETKQYQLVVTTDGLLMRPMKPAESNPL